MSESAKGAEEPGGSNIPHGDRTYRPAWIRAMPFLGRPPALTRRQWRVLGLVAAASFFEQYDLYLFSLALKQIQVDLAIPEAQLGFFGSLIPFGWRGLYLVGLGPLLVLAYWRRTLPETVRFEVHRRHRAAVPQGEPTLRPLADLIRMYPGRLVAVVSVVFMVALAESPAGFFGPKYLQDAHGWSPAAVGLLTFWGGALAIVGNTFAGRLSDRWGRRRATILFLVGQVAFTIIYYNAFGPLLVPIWIGMIFVILGANVTLAAFGAELFPTSYRSTAAGIRVVAATLGASLGLSLESMLYGVLGAHWVAICGLAALTLIGALIVAAVFPETAGHTLEDISPERA